MKIDWDGAVAVGEAMEVFEALQERFTSANAIPVERATIKAHEYAALLTAWEFLTREEAPLP